MADFELFVLPFNTNLINMYKLCGEVEKDSCPCVENMMHLPQVLDRYLCPWPAAFGKDTRLKLLAGDQSIMSSTQGMIP